jgi:hypothetical protein
MTARRSGSERKGGRKCERPPCRDCKANSPCPTSHGAQHSPSLHEQCLQASSEHSVNTGTLDAELFRNGPWTEPLRRKPAHPSRTDTRRAALIHPRVLGLCYTSSCRSSFRTQRTPRVYLGTPCPPQRWYRSAGTDARARDNGGRPDGPNTYKSDGMKHPRGRDVAGTVRQMPPNDGKRTACMRPLTHTRVI